jgi:hypothetical protein
MNTLGTRYIIQLGTVTVYALEDDNGDLEGGVTLDQLNFYTVHSDLRQPLIVLLDTDTPDADDEVLLKAAFAWGDYEVTGAVKDRKKHETTEL